MSNLEQYAVFGDPIGHTLSPRIHRLFAEQTNQNMEYRAIRAPADQFRSILAHFLETGGRGANCTLPLKELAFTLADSVTQRARFCGAVNTLSVEANGALVGDNTDGVGLIRDLKINLELELNARRVLILGAGGAARGILGPLIEEKPESLTVANRTVAKAKNLAEDFSGIETIIGCGYESLGHQSFDLIINATSTSLSGGLPDLGTHLLSQNGCCYDLAYKLGGPTPFVTWGIEQGARSSHDGLGMLVEQAAEAFYLWRNIRPDTKSVIVQLKEESGA
jgi:shikimate dehydrogenase